MGKKRQASCALSSMRILSSWSVKQPLISLVTRPLGTSNLKAGFACQQFEGKGGVTFTYIQIAEHMGNRLLLGMLEGQDNAANKVKDKGTEEVLQQFKKL